MHITSFPVAKTVLGRGQHRDRELPPAHPLLSWNPPFYL